MKTTTRRTMAAAGAAAVLLLGAAGTAVAGGPNGGGQGPSGGNGPVAGSQVRAGDGSADHPGAGPMRNGKGQGNGAGAMGDRGAGQQGSGDCLTAAPVADLTQEQEETLIHMRQEEQLAHDLYVALGEKWDNDTFTRIANSESRHMAAVQRLLDRYDLTVPAPADGEQFADDGLQKLWDELLAKGMTSEDAALEVGRTVELADIADLEAALKDGQPADIEQVYENLLAASKHHLAAFGG